MPSFRLPAALPLLLCTGCVFPAYTASRTVDLTIPAAGITTLECTSHNGAIHVQGEADATEVQVHAVLSVRGYSQGEADDNLRLLSVGKDVANGTLTLYGAWPTGSMNNLSPSVEFTVKMPRDTALTLTSHNGDLRARGTVGDQRLATHNGDIDAQVNGRNVLAESHNGRIGLDLLNQGPVDGTVESHNGSIELHLGAGVGAQVTAATHNGDIVTGGQLQDVRLSRRTLSARVGDGSGKLAVTTHNGDVHIR